jgi:hypothetical protein
MLSNAPPIISAALHLACRALHRRNQPVNRLPPFSAARIRAGGRDGKESGEEALAGPVPFTPGAVRTSEALRRTVEREASLVCSVGLPRFAGRAALTGSVAGVDAVLAAPWSNHTRLRCARRRHLRCCSSTSRLRSPSARRSRSPKPSAYGGIGLVASPLP